MDGGSRLKRRKELFYRMCMVNSGLLWTVGLVVGFTTRLG